ncbi:MAG: MarC family protein [Planctomycetota bacterium]
MTIIQAAVLLFFVMDPLGNIPYFVMVLEKVEPERRRRVLIRELLIAYGLMLFFLFFGAEILHLFSISDETLRIGGGIVLFLIGIGIVFPAKDMLMSNEDANDHEPLVVPLAVPLIAGPSAMTMIIVLARQSDRAYDFDLVLSLTLASAASAVILLMSSFLYRFIGKRGFRAIARLMGMILILISIEMVMTGIKKAFNL